MTYHAIETSLPVPPPGLFDLAYAALDDGMLALLRVDRDVVGGRARGRPGAPSGAKGTTAYLALFDGLDELPLFAMPLDLDFPLLDRLPDGSWVMADARCRAGESNARVVAPDGRLIRRFRLGDGIEHLQCDAAGSVWVGYFDEGVFGDDPVATAGLARFDAQGKVVWEFPDVTAFIADCYALNVTGQHAWACPYTDFPILAVDAGGRIRRWENSVAGARALAVDRGRVVLAGGYGDDHDRLALLTLEGDDARVQTTFRLDLPAPGDGRVSLLQGRGSVIHDVRAGIWRRIAVADLIAATTG